MNSQEYQEFSKTCWFCKISLSKLSYIDLYYAIVAYTVTIYTILCFLAVQDITSLCHVWFFQFLDVPSGKWVVWDNIYIKNKHNTQLCFELVREVEVKGSPRHIWKERRGGLCWSSLSLRLDSMFPSTQERHPALKSWGSGNQREPAGSSH